MTQWLDIARANLGLREAPGKANNPKVVAFYAEAGHPEIKSDETAWCAAFVGACLKRADYPNTGDLTARSYLKYGKALDEPQEGCIVVLKRGHSTWQGHVGFCVGWTSRTVKILGGNQSDAVTIASFPMSQVLGYRWPVEPTRKALKDAGSKEITVADAAEKIATGGAVVTAAAKAADETGMLEPVKDVSTNVGILTSLLSGVQSLGKLVAANIGLSTLVLLVVAVFVARWWIKHRIARAESGHPLSAQG